MSAMGITILAVVVVDQAIKLMLQRSMGNERVGLGLGATVRVIAGQIWFRRLGHRYHRLTMWGAWLAAASALIVCSALAPFNIIFVGLLLGGSLSHAVESSWRGFVIDYVCLRGWPAFNLADLALAAGAIGIMGELLIMMHQRIS